MQKGTQFDPDIVDMFLFLMDGEKKIQYDNTVYDNIVKNIETIAETMEKRY